MKILVFAFLFAISLQPALAKDKDQGVELQVTEKGFEPSSVDVKPGVPVVLKVHAKNRFDLRNPDQNSIEEHKKGSSV